MIHITLFSYVKCDITSINWLNQDIVVFIVVHLTLYILSAHNWFLYFYVSQHVLVL